jgi:hypothetical protein
MRVSFAKEKAMATFDRENATRNKTMEIRDRTGSNAPAWIAGLVIVAAIVIGAVVYEFRGTHESVAPTATHETTQPVNPAPSPATKP